jgi:hypothetical protein
MKTKPRIAEGRQYEPTGLKRLNHTIEAIGHKD